VPGPGPATTSLTAQGTLPPLADNLTHAVTDSAGAAIEGLATQPQTQFVADAARDAMTHSVTLAGYIAAGVIVLGLIATAFIRTQLPTSPPDADRAREGEPSSGRHRQVG
jgi:hypothetical protein